MTENEIEKMIEEEPQPGIQELMEAYGGSEEYDTETGTDDIEHHPSEYAPNELPEKPAYDREIDENVDDALEDAYKTCKIANNEYLENMLKNELASYRYSHL